MSCLNISSLASPFFPTLELLLVHSCPISSGHGRSSSRSDSAFFEDLSICLASFPCLSILEPHQARVGAWSSRKSRGEGEGGTLVSQTESRLLPWANSAQDCHGWRGPCSPHQRTLSCMEGPRESSKPFQVSCWARGQ